MTDKNLPIYGARGEDRETQRKKPVRGEVKGSKVTVKSPWD